MGYLKYLKRTLAPLCTYKLEGGASEGELYAVGKELDELCAEIDIALRESIPTMARSFGLDKFGELLPYVPINKDEENLALSIAALMRIRNGCFTHELLQATLKGCGLDAVVTEGEEANTCVISFPKDRGIPTDVDELKWRIEEILPCHIEASYIYAFAKWGELLDGFATWGDLLDANEIWNDLESYYVEES